MKQATEKVVTDEMDGQKSLVSEIVQATRLCPDDEAYSLTRRGVEALMAKLLMPGAE